MKRLLSVTGTGLLVFLLLASKVFAANEFETTYKVRYEVKSNGKTLVNQNISLVNKLSNVYATQYSLSLQTGRIENIQAYDEEGPLRVEVKEEGETTTIKLFFNQQVVGTGKTLNFHLSYEVLDLAQKNGEVWEITIPKLSQQNQIDNYSLTLVVPLSFGNPAFITPKPVEQKQEGGFNLYRFTKNQLLQSGVSAAFGEFQIFDFSLSYHLENPGLSLGETEIALPPDTAFQRIFYQKIEPRPLNIRVDEDGNWLAKYRLGPGERINITVLGKVKIFAQPQERFLPPSEETLKKNLLPQKYWEVDNPLIQAKAKELKTARAIYQYVIKTLDYDFGRVKQGVQRLGAVEALKNPQGAICMEFTDLFIALARAAGIPAREVNGYAYTTNVKLRPLSLVADVLHAWPEYWDEKTQVWRPVDPTWEKTTGGIDHFYKTDLSHFAFSIHGLSSQEPYPAGSYKTQGGFGKDVQVVFGQYEGEDTPKYEVVLDLPKKIFAGVGGKGKVVIKNTGQSAVYNLSLKLGARNLNLTPLNFQGNSIAVLPPYSQKEIFLRLEPASWLSFGRGALNVWLEGQKYTSEIEIASLVWQLALPLLGIIFALALGILFVLKIRHKLKNEGAKKTSPTVFS